MFSCAFVRPPLPERKALQNYVKFLNWQNFLSNFLKKFIIFLFAWNFIRPLCNFFWGSPQKRVQSYNFSIFWPNIFASIFAFFNHFFANQGIMGEPGVRENREDREWWENREWWEWFEILKRAAIQMKSSPERKHIFTYWSNGLSVWSLIFNISI